MVSDSYHNISEVLRHNPRPMPLAPPITTWKSYNANDSRFDRRFFNERNFENLGKIKCSPTNVALGSIIKLRPDESRRRKEVYSVYPDSQESYPATKLFEHPVVVLDIWDTGNGENGYYALVSPISSKQHSGHASGGKVFPLSRPYDRKFQKQIYGGLQEHQIMEMEFYGGTFEKGCWFQTNQAWVINLNMAIPFNKLLWANRLTHQSYRDLMAALRLRPGVWTRTEKLWMGRERDYEWTKSKIYSGIVIEGLSRPTSKAVYPTPPRTQTPAPTSSPAFSSPKRKISTPEEESAAINLSYNQSISPKRVKTDNTLEHESLPTPTPSSDFKAPTGPKMWHEQNSNGSSKTQWAQQQSFGNHAHTF